MVSHADPIEENNQDVEEARGRRGSRAEHRDRKPPKDPPRMHPAEVESELVRMGVLLPFLHQLRLADLAREFEIYDTVAPLFDPTSWMRGHTSVEKNRDCVRILLQAQREIRKLFPAELPPEAAR